MKIALVWEPELDGSRCGSSDSDFLEEYNFQRKTSFPVKKIIKYVAVMKYNF